MAITPDKDPMNIVTSTIAEEVTEKVGKSIKKIVKSGVLVGSPGVEILKKIKKKISK